MSLQYWVVHSKIKELWLWYSKQVKYLKLYLIDEREKHGFKTKY
jgi:hypothetical protein